MSHLRPLAAIAALAACLGGPAAAAPLACDLLFAGGRVVDGTGAPWFKADVCVVGEKIAAVGKLDGATAKRKVDATGLVVGPGFIDMMGQSEYNLLVDNRGASKITQGITTEMTGEGTSIAPANARMIAANKEIYERYKVKPDWTTLAGYWKAFARARPALNQGRSSARAPSATSSSARRTARRRPRSSGRWRPPWPRPWRKGPSASPPRSSTCPTASPRPRRSSPWPRWPRAPAGRATAPHPAARTRQ